MDGRGLLTLTFDDAYLNQYELAYPLLERYGYRGVVYVVAGLVGGYWEGRELMGLTHLRELVGRGWEIGSHTYSHPRLNILAPHAVEKELTASRDWLTRYGFSPISFAYPFGLYNEDVKAAASKVYRYSRTVDEGLNELVDSSADLRVCRLYEDPLAELEGRFDPVERCLAMVRRAKEDGKWAIAMIHGVVESVGELPTPYDTFFWITRSKLELFLRQVEAIGIEVATFKELADVSKR
jgi:peptidoglycan/xylan/chitin deacetylase (PgdA/CDA1 family)